MAGTIGKYRIAGEIARGGMGAIYRAHDPDAGRDVAIKVLAVDAAPSEHQLERFRRECLAIARVEHPNVVRIHDAGQHQGRPYLVQDLIEGPSLEERLREAFPVREAAQAVCVLARALEFAHGLGVFHRDVKPANVLLAAHGPVLVDFGLAKDTSLIFSKPSLTKTGTGLGSPGYWSPEQAAGAKEGASGEPVGASSDVYSLGATLYALLTGGPPFVGRTVLEDILLTVSRPPEPPSRARAEVDPGLEQICLRCLEKDPADRYPSAGALADDLRRWLEGEPIASAPRRSPLPLLGVVVALVLGWGLSASSKRGIGQASVSAVDTSAPVVRVTGPGDLQTSTAATVTVTGTVQDGSAVTVSVGRTALKVLAAPAGAVLAGEAQAGGSAGEAQAGGSAGEAQAGGSAGEAQSGRSSAALPERSWAVEVPLKVGLNTLEIRAVDAHGFAAPSRRIRVLRAPAGDRGVLPAPSASGEIEIVETVTIAARQSLVLPPGTTLAFASGAGLICRGQLWALGTAAQPVRFQPSGDSWDGLRFEGPAALAVLTHATLRGAAPDVLGDLARAGTGRGAPTPFARPSTPGATLQRGGALTLLGGARLFATDTTIHDSSVGGANAGGALHARGTPDQPTHLELHRSTLRACQATSAGGLYLGAHAALRLQTCTLTGNTSTERGGALVAEGPGPPLELLNVTVQDNHSQGEGGGLLVDRPATLQDCLLSANTSKEFGGGLHTPTNAASPLTVTGTQFLNNTAATGGGAALACDATLENCEFQGNNDAGVFAWTGVRLVFNEVRFLDSPGAGVILIGVAAKLRGCRFVGNEAGGLRINNSQVECFDGRFEHNRADEGAGVWSILGGTLTLSQTQFVGNRADSMGGAIHTASGTPDEPADLVLTLDRCEFAENTAPIGPNVVLGAGTVFAGDQPDPALVTRH